MLYVLSVGTNMGNRTENIIKCREAINLVPYTEVVSSSAVYETEPLGYSGQENFYNCVFLAKSGFEPNEMLGICMGIEAGFGRIRSCKNGPRVIDIDIIFAENLTVRTPNLMIPHPHFQERRFVLRPMLDIFTDGTAFGIEFQSYLDAITGQNLRKTEQNI